MRFVEINGTHINVDEICDFFYTNEGSLRIDYRHGESYTTHVCKPRLFRDEIMGARHVVQVLPNNAPFWMVWENDDKTHFATPADFLALCADGHVRAMYLSDGYFEVIESRNYVGLFSEDELSQFDSLEKCGVGQT